MRSSVRARDSREVISVDINTLMPRPTHQIRTERVYGIAAVDLWNEIDRVRLSSLPLSSAPIAFRHLPAILTRHESAPKLFQRFLDVTPLTEVNRTWPEPILSAGVAQPWVLAACCAIAEPHRAGGGWMRSSALVMLVAMADSSVVGLVPPVLWAVAVAVVGVASVAADRSAAGVTATGLRVHRGLAALAMAALLLGHSGSASGVHAHSALGLGVVVAALSSVVVAGGLVLTGTRCAARGRLSTRERVAALEPALMAIAVGSMLLG